MCTSIPTRPRTMTKVRLIIRSIISVVSSSVYVNVDMDKDDDDDDDSSSSDENSDDEGIEIEAPDAIPNETHDEYYLRTRDFWLAEARKELKISDGNDESVRVQHMAKQMSKLFFQS